VRIVVNGQEREVPEGESVAGLLRSIGSRPVLLAVERNGEVVPRGAFDATRLEAGDRLEIVGFVGGG
jgi:thiamine biosynthesis protein ThiS